MDRCELFKIIAADVWNEISRNHRRGNRLSEEGLTRDTIISDIMNYVEDHNSFQVFAQKAKNEVQTGGDLEIYIDNGNDNFTRILLQAKLMELEGCFRHLDRDSGSSGRKQYDTLIRFSKKVQSDAYYLMYNGCPDYEELNSDCAGKYNEKQYGCAILPATFIKEYCVNNSTGTLGSSGVHKPFGEPWRILACCGYTNNKDSKVYTPDEIDMDPYFRNLFTSSNRIKFITGKELSNSKRIFQENESIHSNGWKPTARIIVSKEGMYKNKDGLLEI